jgi:predicted nucleic acid-binding protein
MRGVLDTSVFIAEKQGRDLAAERLPDEAAISVVTLAELTIGAHLAEAEAVRAQRLRTVQAAQATYAALPVDEAVAAAFAELVATARRNDRRPKGCDSARPWRIRHHPGWGFRRPRRRRRTNLTARSIRVAGWGGSWAGATKDYTHFSPTGF